MRAVIDTNVLLSGLFWRGPPHSLLGEVRAGALTLVSSSALIAELAGVITRRKFREVIKRSDLAPDRILAELRLSAEIIDPWPLLAPVSRDRDDDNVLAAAAAAHPDLIISGDTDLLVLGTHAGIPIVTPAHALSIVGAAPT